MAIDVFVSYHAQTGLETARAVVQKLEANGLRCWYQERDSGGYYASMITRTVATCGVFVVILSQGATKSKFVKSELAMAFERDGLQILPLRVSADKLSDSATFYLSGLHWIDGVERPLDAALQDLCTRALKVLGRSTPISGAVIPAKTETIRYNDGCVYTGQVVNGKRHGKGTLTWPSGSVYEGDWRDDKRTGKGKYTWPSGNVYEGDFVDGNFTGKGKKIWANGSVYEGDWRDDKRTGKGKYTWSDGDIYEGDWRDDKRTGKGKYTWPSGTIYEGDFVDGKITGKGKKIWPNGDTYEGDWRNDMKNGKGKYTWGKNTQWAGDVYVGDWQDDGRTGTGTYTYADGRIQSGRWKDGKFLG